MIRVEAIWLCVEPLDMRAGTESALARVVAVFGSARPHTAYLFANRRANRMKVLVYDGIGVWLAARRLNSGKFAWPRDITGTVTLSREQLDALVFGLPWQRLGEAGVIRVLRSNCGICSWSATAGPGMIRPVISDAKLASIDKPVLLAIVQSLRDELAFKQKVIDKITHEMAVLKRLKFAATSEHFSPEQRSLLEETIDTDLAAAQAELDKARAAAKAAAPADKETPKRKPLPPELPRTEHRHSPRARPVPAAAR